MNPKGDKKYKSALGFGEKKMEKAQESVKALLYSENINKFWSLLKVIEGLSGRLWQSLKDFDSLWKTLTAFERLWQYFKDFDSISEVSLIYLYLHQSLRSPCSYKCLEHICFQRKSMLFFGH